MKSINTPDQFDHQLPWPVWAVVLGGLCMTVGILWDISWHETIGRDTFWTPAHLLIHFGGITGGASGAWLIWKATFGGDQTWRDRSIRIAGLYGPLGAWICLWGCLAMLTSAPLDDWWHNAYGLDVKILSPPHMVLAAGMYSLVVGGVLITLSWNNQASATLAPRTQALLIAAGGIVVTLSSVVYTEFSRPNSQHTAFFYKLTSIAYVAPLVYLARAIQHRWAATMVAAIYMGIYCLLIWILPLFAAEPMLAPIYHPVDAMVPPPFPLLLVVPAIAIDLVLRLVSPDSPAWKQWLLSVGLGVAFFAVFFPVEWHFAAFLLTPAADNHFFAGNRYWAYFERVGDWRDDFWGLSRDPMTLGAALAAILGACLSARVGLWLGHWMLRLRR